jgi:hypothetical protein
VGKQQVLLLSGNGPNALLRAVVGPSNLFDLVHCQHSYPPLPLDRPRSEGSGIVLTVGPL